MSPVPITCPELLSDGVVRTLAGFPGVQIIINGPVAAVGGCAMTNNNFGGVTVTGNKGNMSLGSDNVINDNRQEQQLIDITQELLKIIQSANAPGEKKNEISSAVTQVAEQVKSEGCNKLSVHGILAGIGSAMQTINTTPTLIETFTKWKDFIMQIVG